MNPGATTMPFASMRIGRFAVGDQAYRRDGVAANSYVPVEPWRTGAVHHFRAGDQDVETIVLRRKRERGDEKDQECSHGISL